MSSFRRNKNNFDEENWKNNEQNGFTDRQNPISWQNKDHISPKNTTKPSDNLKALESKLMILQMDKKRLEDELSKIPTQGRRMAQIKRKEEIELELEILNSNISAVKFKLRQVNAL